MGGTATTGGVTVAWAAATDVGNHRSVNEDSVLASPSVFVVADGMGGHHAGDVASRLVVEEFESLTDGDLRSVQDVVGLLVDVNRSILDRGRRSRALSGMGTTAVGLLLVDNGDRASWLLFNIGDSRAYRRAEGRFELLSVDHSYVQELVDAGEIAAGEARTHPHRNVVTRALGVEEAPKPDLWLHSPRAGERFLLCTDGLSSEVDDPDIAKGLATGTPEQAANTLVARALAAGGHDNVTVLVLDVLDVDDEAGSAITAPRELILAELTVPRVEASSFPQDEPTSEQPAAQLDAPTLEQPLIEVDVSTVGPSAGSRGRRPRRGGGRREQKAPVTDASLADAGEAPAAHGLIDRVPGQAELEELTPEPDEMSCADDDVPARGRGVSVAGSGKNDRALDGTEEPGDADVGIDHTGVVDPAEGASGADATDAEIATEVATDDDDSHDDNTKDATNDADVEDDVSGGAPDAAATNTPDEPGGQSALREPTARTSSGRSARRARGKKKETGP